MELSEFNERITIREKYKTKEPNGERTTSYQDVQTVWAKAIPTSGDESITAGKKTAMQRYRFIIRHRDLSPSTNDIYWRGQSWDINFINPYHKEGYRNYIEIKAQTSN